MMQYEISDPFLPLHRSDGEVVPEISIIDTKYSL